MHYLAIEDLIGNTPLVQLKRIPGEDARQRNNIILGKMEGNNPAGSVKDRPAMSMIRHAEERGDIKPGDTLIEATSGNTGIALAMARARTEMTKHAKHWYSASTMSGCRSHSKMSRWLMTANALRVSVLRIESRPSSKLCHKPMAAGDVC